MLKTKFSFYIYPEMKDLFKITGFCSIFFLLISCGTKEPDQQAEQNANPFDSVNPHLMDTLQHLASLGYYDLELGRYCDDVLSPNCIFYTFVNVLDSGTLKEFVLLLQHEDPLIRLYAFSALYDYETPVFSHLKSFISDSSIVNYKEKGLSSQASVGELAVKFSLQNFLLSQPQRDSLRSFIFAHSENFSELDKMLLYYSPSQEHYEAIKKLAGSQSAEAIVALSKFRKKEDLATIKKCLSYEREIFDPIVFRAAGFFHDTVLFEALLEFPSAYLAENKNFACELEHFYLALASYQDAKSIPVFKKCLDPANYETPVYLKLNKTLVYNALSNHMHPVFSDLRNGLSLQIPYYARRYVYADISLPTYW
jgi:hypothetical protein